MASLPKHASLAYAVGTVREDDTKKLVWIFFGFVVAGLGSAAMSGASLSWDGSAYFFNALDSQSPTVPHGRLIGFMPQLAVLVFSHFTQDMNVLQAVFGLAYATLPVVALLASWWIVRQRSPWLFVWPALGIGLATLPGQFAFVVEASLSVQLFWPILLIMLTRFRSRHLAALLAFSTAVFFSHPFSIVLFGIAAGVALAIGLRFRIDPRKMWLWVLGFATIAAVAAVRFVVTKSNYEVERISLDVMVETFQSSVAGFPLVALLVSLITAFLILGAPLVKRLRPAHTLPIYAAELSGVVLAGGLLCLWAGNPFYWKYVLDYRNWVLFCSLPFMGMAIVEGLVVEYAQPHSGYNDWEHRSRTIVLVGLVFWGVLSIQSIVWSKLTKRLETAIARSPYACVSVDSMIWMATTPLDHWAVTPYSLVTQGKTPRRVILSESDCAAGDFSDGIPLAAWQYRDWAFQGWFDLRFLKQTLQEPHGCWFVPASGWYDPEGSDQVWWRWSDGHGEIVVYLAESTEVVLHGSIETVEQPNQVDLLVNNERLTTLDITWDGMSTISPQRLSLQEGRNVVEFISHNPAIVLPPDPRELSIAVSNLTLQTDDGRLVCEFSSPQ